MDITNSLLFTLLILLLLALSWMLGYYARHKSLSGIVGRRFAPDPDYFVGLNYLLNDEPDDAIDVFIDALEINSTTFDTHLALGKLLRRRGKVDRSIAHYEFLLEQHRFNSRQENEIRIQLLRSFIAAGLLDRAEELAAELRRINSSVQEEALALAVMLYQIEKDWPRALDAAGELLQLCPPQHRYDMLMQISHFHCEIAEGALQRHELDHARNELKRALKLFKGNLRVYLLLARTDYLAGEYQDALGSLLKALQLEPGYFSEIYPLVKQYGRAVELDIEQRFLHDMEPELGGDSAYHAEICSRLLETEGVSAALRYLLDSLRKAPSLALLEQAMQLAAEQQVLQQQVLHSGAEIIELYLHTLARYRCENCGFELKSLHWACPGCNCWGMVKPVGNQIPSALEKQAPEE